MANRKTNRSPLDAVSYADIAAGFLGRAPVGEARPPAATTHVLFCDETGNSGSKFYCPEQPLYAEGGWLIRHENRPILAEAFLKLEKDFKFTPRTKGTRLKDSPQGRACIAEALRMISEHATPFFYAVEKRYFICAKAVECFYDPNYNPEINPLETHSRRIRSARADLLYLAPDRILMGFAEAFRNRDPAGLLKSANAWGKFFVDEGALEMARQLAGCLRTLRSDMEREFASLEKMGLPKGYDSLNAPSLAQALQLIEQRCPPCDIVHDQCETMEATYRFFFEKYRNAHHGAVHYLDGPGQIFGFRNVTTLSFGNSESEPLLRACDYLLAACVDFTRRAISDEDIPATIREAAYHGLGRMLRQATGDDRSDSRTDAQIGEIMAADRWIAKVGSRFKKK